MLKEDSKMKRVVCFFTTVTLVIILSGFVFSKEPHSEKRPNILFIIVDDQSPFDFKFYNPSSTLNAPCIENLAREGMVFDAAYHMGSFSAPSVHPVGIW